MAENVCALDDYKNDRAKAMTNLEPLWRRMAGEISAALEEAESLLLYEGATPDFDAVIEAKLAERLAGVLGAAQAVPIAFGKYHYGDTGQYAALLEATNLLRIALERLLKGEG